MASAAAASFQDGGRACAPGRPVPVFPPAGSATPVAERRLPFGLGGGPGRRPARCGSSAGGRYCCGCWGLPPAARKVSAGWAVAGAVGGGPPGRRSHLREGPQRAPLLASCPLFSPRCPGLGSAVGGAAERGGRCAPASVRCPQQRAGGRE